MGKSYYYFIIVYYCNFIQFHSEATELVLGKSTPQVQQLLYIEWPESYFYLLKLHLDNNILYVTSTV